MGSVAKAAPKPAAKSKPAAAKKAAPAAKKAAPKAPAAVAAKLLGKHDANHDGSVKVAKEATRNLGTTASGVSAEVDRSKLFAKADTSGDGTVTKAEMTALVKKFDADHDGKLSKAELGKFDNLVRATDKRTTIAADGTRTAAERGFFQADGKWFFRNEWGSVAPAKDMPSWPNVVHAPAGFDPSTVKNADQATPVKRGAAADAAAGADNNFGADTSAPANARKAGTTLRGEAAVFNGPGVFIDDPANFSDAQAKAAHDAGFTWIAAQGYNVDDKGNPVRREHFTAGWVQHMHDLGFKVGAWNVLGAQPQADAKAASDLINETHLDMFIADAEAAHKGDAGGDASRSKVFLDAFRATQPHIALGLSTYGAASGNNLLGSTHDPHAGPMDFQSWADAGAVFMPQVYPKDFGDVYSLDNVVAHSDRAGWDRSELKPTLGFYRGETPEFYANLKAAGTQGFSVYLGENITDPSFWARMVAQDA